MTLMMAYCGLLCNECAAYIATSTNDDLLRQKTAEEWSTLYNADIQPENINCLGCKSETRLGHCYVCAIRKCAVEKSLANCGLCTDFPCSNLDQILQAVPECKSRLDQAR